jgi:KaiC/GvpD/RAD55 family RecA-like ATPase
LKNISTYSCDASQRKVLDRILDKGESVVVRGYPGTGKSQTIVNLLRCAAAMGKKVVFVAEKDAAFESIIEKINPNWLGSEAKKRDENTLFDAFILDARYISFKQKRKSEYRNESRNAGNLPTKMKRTQHIALSSRCHGSFSV